MSVSWAEDLLFKPFHQLKIGTAARSRDPGANRPPQAGGVRLLLLVLGAAEMHITLNLVPVRPERQVELLGALAVPGCPGHRTTASGPRGPDARVIAVA
ncbi:hypothetical protein AB0M95_30770 [Sphaerisporangium sp. NPDC051017]|uniref:hypothetical protein n=1 Tax=Sphaerisporangium sp. NPDC051017 TaxID=3154636 RepID=UPI00344546C0